MGDTIPGWKREFQIAQWNSHSQVLNRIKVDEQKWLLFALLALSGFLGLLIGGFEGLLPQLGTGGMYNLFLTATGIAQLFAWFWIDQALTLRVQYYRALGRLISVQEDLQVNRRLEWTKEDCEPTDHLPTSRFCFAVISLAWWGWRWTSKKSVGERRTWLAAAERWRKTVTKPWESKFHELLFVVVALAVTHMSTAFAMTEIGTVGEGVGSALYVWAAVVSSVSIILWPFIVYPLWDRRKLRVIYDEFVSAGAG